ncbi:MAG: hypothetical protein QOG80_736 [Pseudonocardiales bacterium]|jgi:hypothetical protein|nr:hypothetical protein [Pseudonocardiales bacterium]
MVEPAEADVSATEAHREHSTQAVHQVREVLDSLAERPLVEHAEIYEDLHARLQRTLAEIEGG